MNIYLIIISFVFAFLGTYTVKKFASKKNIIDIPNIRSSHIQPTPRGGGLAVAITWNISISFLFIIHEIPDQLFFSLLCGVPISLIGLLDDIMTISPKIRLFVQVICAFFAVIFLGGINEIDIGFEVLHLRFVISLLAVIGIVWFTNLFNFLDGIDGYISIEIIFICSTVFYLLGFEIPILLASATAGFLIWNWQPAKIFMGDVGSTLLGFTIGIFAVYCQNTDQSSIVIWLMITSLFWFDATLTLLRRLRNKEQLSVAHKKHAYQRLVQSGFSHQKTVLFSLLVNIPIFIFTWLAIMYPTLLLPLFGINLIYLYYIVRQVDKRCSFSKF